MENRIMTGLRRLISHVFDAPTRESADSAQEASAPHMTASSQLRVSAHGAGIIILHIPSGRIFTCNSTGHRIWKGLTSGASPDAVSEEISRDFGVDSTMAREHTYAFVATLEHEGLLVRTQARA